MIDFFFLTESVWEADVPPSSIEMCLSLLHQVYARMWFFENLHGSVYWPAYFIRHLSLLVSMQRFLLLHRIDLYQYPPCQCFRFYIH